MSKNFVNPYSAMIQAKALAEATNLTIKFDSSSNAVPKASNTSIVMPAPSPSFSDEEWTKWWGSFYHEIGHHTPECRDTVEYISRENVNMTTPYGQILNWVDDYRQEKFGYNEYAGKKQAMSKARALHHQHIINNGTEKLGEELGQDLEGDIARTMLGQDVRAREDWMNGIEGDSDKLQKMFHPDVNKNIKKMEELGYVDKLNACETVEDEIELSKEILENIFELDPEEEQKKAEGSGDGNGGEGNPQKGQAGDGEGEEGDGEGQEGEQGEGKGDGKGQRATGHRDVKWEDLQMHDHSDLAQSHSSQHIDYASHIHGDGYIPYPADRIDIMDFHENKLTIGEHSHTGIENFDLDRVSSYTTEAIREAAQGESLSRQVARLLQIHTRDRYKFGKKKGKMHNKNLYRATMADAAGFNQKIFKKRESNDALDVAITVLGDCSGSMGGGNKFENMGKSMVLLGKVLGDLGVNHELLGFTDTGNMLMYIYKPFGVRKVAPLKIAERVARSAGCMSNNADGDSILWSANRLEVQRDKRKILIVLSDGSPAGGYRTKGGGRGDEYTFTKKVIKDIESNPHMEIYGIGIEDDNVKRLYQENQVINHSEELEGALLKLIQRKIIQ